MTIAKEPSTWAGLASLATTVQMFLATPRHTVGEWCMFGGSVLAGVAAVFMREGQSATTAPQQRECNPSLTVVNANVLAKGGGHGAREQQ